MPETPSGVLTNKNTAMGQQNQKDKINNLVDKNYVFWRINTPALIKEIIDCTPGTGIFRAPFQIFMEILSEIGERASELNDPIMNGLMCRLAIYEMADPYSNEYDKALLDATLEKYKNAIATKKKNSIKTNIDHGKK
jgi:hypothetical protein